MDKLELYKIQLEAIKDFMHYNKMSKGVVVLEDETLNALDKVVQDLSNNLESTEKFGFYLGDVINCRDSLKTMGCYIKVDNQSLGHLIKAIATYQSLNKSKEPKHQLNKLNGSLK